MGWIHAGLIDSQPINSLSLTSKSDVYLQCTIKVYVRVTELFKSHTKIIIDFISRFSHVHHHHWHCHIALAVTTIIVVLSIKIQISSSLLFVKFIRTVKNN